MAASPGRKRKANNVSLWMRVNQALNFLLALLLGITAYLQVRRADAVIWVVVFLVPAVITFLTSIKIHLSALPEVKVVSSVHIACCLCLLVYLGIRLIHGMANQFSTIIMFDGNDVIQNSYNPLDYQEGWEIIALILVVAWMKYLASTSREHMRESGMKPVEISPLWMLKAMGVVVVVPLGLASFCYIEGVNSTAKALYGSLRSASDPLPPVYNPVAQPQSGMEH
ncbi:transmembrane protein 220-like [Macrobrachium nipponense]|uniref:transmembrane protein 220-like n=1 Tax=Macrobrachium nipponense TaxID=159736 RepID=UPI0030C7D8DA